MSPNIEHLTPHQHLTAAFSTVVAGDNSDLASACSGIGRPTQGSQAGAASNAAANRLTTNDALSYLRDVKQKFSDNKEVYDTFLEIMKKFKAQR